MKIVADKSVRAPNALTELLGRASRFAIVGIVSGCIFLGVGGAMISLGGVEPRVASSLGYLAAVPVNFAANRRFTFRVKDRGLGQLLRFGALHAANALLSAFSMATAIDAFGLHYTTGLLLTVLLVPAVNFAVMNWWVFRRSESRSSSP